MHYQIHFKNNRWKQTTDSRMVPTSLSSQLLPGAEILFATAYPEYLLLQELTIDGFIISYHSFLIQSSDSFRMLKKHSSATIHYMLAGECQLFNGSSNISLLEKNQSCLHFVNENMIYELKISAGQHRMFELNFSFSLLKKLTDGYRAFSQLHQQGKDRLSMSFFYGVIDIQKRTLLIINNILIQSLQYPMPVTSLNNRCLELALRFVKDMDLSKQLEGWVNQKKLQFDQLETYILSHLEIPDLQVLSASHFIKKMGLSTYQFRKLTQQAFGMSLTAFIKTKRMIRAMELLTQTAIPINEIYVMIGYEDFSSFTRAFTKYYSHSPSYYRRQK